MGGKYSSVPCTRDSAHKTFGPTHLTSTYSVNIQRVFGRLGIEPKTSGLESDALTTHGPPLGLDIKAKEIIKKERVPVLCAR
ncbi:hypothetical protein TNCV_474571 [Trichonephila clavipes]|nr:hypothetical protein TNCV_474571 [Trichonephila clavipes]